VQTVKPKEAAPIPPESAASKKDANSSVSGLLKGMEAVSAPPMLFGGALAGEVSSGGASLASSGPGWAFPVGGEGNAEVPVSLQEPSRPKPRKANRKGRQGRGQKHLGAAAVKREDTPVFAIPGPVQGSLSFDSPKPFAAGSDGTGGARGDIAFGSASLPLGGPSAKNDLNNNFSFGAAAASNALEGLKEDVHPVSPGALLGLRALFAGAVWRHGAVSDLMSYASYIRFQDNQKEQAKEKKKKSTKDKAAKGTSSPLGSLPSVPPPSGAVPLGGLWSAVLSQCLTTLSEQKGMREIPKEKVVLTLPHLPSLTFLY